MKKTLIILALVLGFSTQAQTRCEELKTDLTYLIKAVKEYEAEKPIDEDKAGEYITEVMSRVDDDNTAYEILNDMLSNDKIPLIHWTLCTMLFKTREWRYRECEGAEEVLESIKD